MKLPINPSDIGRSKRGTWSLRARLILLVVVTISPVLVLGLAVQYTQYVGDKEVASERTLELAHSVSVQIGRELEADIRALQVLAKTGRLRRGAFEEFRYLAESAVSDHLEGANIMVVDENGQQMMNTALPRGVVLPKRQTLDNTKAVFADGEPRVSDVYFGNVVKRAAVAVEVPVKDEQGRVFYTLILDPRPDTFADIIRRQDTRKGVVIALFDREGTVIARWPDSNKYAGQKASASLMPHLKAGTQTTFETNTFDKVPVLTALARVEPFGWTVAIGSPHEDYLGPLWQSLGLIIAGAVVALGVGLGLARFVANQIATPIEALVAYADDTHGDVPPPEVTGLAETDALATAIRRYVETSETAERELVALNTTLEQRIADAVMARDDAQARLLDTQKMEAVGQLTGGIAHDFNNLLTAVIGSLDLIRKQADRDPRLQTLAEIALQGASRGAQLVSQLLAFGRRQTLSPQSLSLDRVLADIHLLIGPATGSEVKVETRLADDLWACYVDRSQLESAILNLVFNANDAMPRGGKLTIAADNRLVDAAAAQRLDITAGDYVRIAISDNGAGMTAETVQRAFEPFFTTKGVGKATGLGLSQVYGFAKQSGGTATIDSRPGEGTTVTLLLPRAAAEAAVPIPLPLGVTPVPPKRILVVEDHKEVRALAQSLLEDLGHEAIVAASAEAALQVLRADMPIDLLFCDVELGGPIDGVKLAEFARDLRLGLRVLLTSGYPDYIQARNAGMAIIAKPYQQADLAAQISLLFQPQASPTFGGGDGQI